MATLETFDFIMEVVPTKYESYWEYGFSFRYKDQPLFNPAITRGGCFRAIDGENGSLLSAVSRAIEYEVDMTDIERQYKDFYWSAFEQDISISITARKWKSGFGNGISTSFRLFVFLDGCFFGNQTYQFQMPGLQLYIGEDMFQRFHDDLKLEMSKITPQV